MEKGFLSLVLHAHLPYVRHADRDDYLEERWVYEAMLESYVPLLIVLEKLIADGIDFRLTMSLTPTLVSMLNDPVIQSRFKARLASCIELALKEGKRTADKPDERRVARMYLARFREIAAYCAKYDYNLIAAFRRLQATGKLELITSAATHAFLPYIETEEALRAQIRIGVETHERILGTRPAGIWLPECGYAPGVDRLLKEAGLRYFFVETHGIAHATPKPRRGVFAPLLTEHGVAAFARDQESTRQVWSAHEGYPGDYDYREYYRDIGYDLDYEYIKPYIHPSGLRINTGFKYHRITGNHGEKAIYNPERAREKAAEHAGDFLFNRERQIAYLAAQMDRKPVVVAPYDAELFGHWWYEGPMFLDVLFRKIACDTEVVKLITPSEYLDMYEEHDRGRLPMCSWGRNGYGEVWLNGQNDWIYRHLHRAERQMIELAETFLDPTPLQARALAQAARELLLAQSSDWAFIMDNKTMVEYAVRRTHDHLARFQTLCERLRQDQLDEAELSRLEGDFPIFPEINVSYYLPACAHKVNISHGSVAAARARTSRPALRVLMLSWEFPPRTVGGLSKAVYDLSRHLVRHDVEVHVLTGSAHGAPEREVMEGIRVQRVRTYQPDGASDFLDWVFQLNLAMADELERLLEVGLAIDLVHAHDWLVACAAIEAKRRFRLPLVATIHATEHGRNHGIHTPLQERIHRTERELICEAWRVIVCSDYMADELKRLFNLPADKLAVLPNGIEPADDADASLVDREAFRRRFALPEEKIIYFVGRMVREKGVHLLLEAAPFVLARQPKAKFVLAGTGPMLEAFRRQAAKAGWGDKVLFTGFVDDETRNRLFRLADVAVFPSLYEPFGIVALEAMSFRAPVLVADTGGLGAIVRHGENGAKMYPGDVQSLVTQLTWMLDSPATCQAMAETALAELSLYDWTRIAGDTLRLYRSIVPEPVALYE